MSYFLLPLSPDDREIMGRSSTIYGFDPLVTFADVMINLATQPGAATHQNHFSVLSISQLLIYVLGWYFTTQISLHYQVYLLYVYSTYIVRALHICLRMYQP